MVRRLIIKTYLQARRLVIVVVGFTILLIGIIMIVLPGPAILIIPLGLAILATEFVWAKRLLHKFKATASQVTNPHKVRRFFVRAGLKGHRIVSNSLFRNRMKQKNPKTDVS